MSQPGSIPVFKNDPILVLALSLVTCGLYAIYWNMKAAEVLNAVVGRELISTPVAVLPLCCPIAYLYYYHLAGQALGPLGEATGQGDALKQKSTLLLILAFFFYPAAAMIVQGHVNELYKGQA